MKQKKMLLMGASSEANNMGLRALCDSSLKVMFKTWKNAEVYVRTFSSEEKKCISVEQENFYFQEMPLFSSKNIFVKPNIYRLLIYAIVLKLFPFKFLDVWLTSKDSYLKRMKDLDFVFDITGGDSFTDLYGSVLMRTNFWFKLTAILLDVDLVLLPQTYGPFNSLFAKTIATYILKNSYYIYSRDIEGISVVKQLLGKDCEKKIVKFIPDLAFVLEPKSLNISIIEEIKKQKEDCKLIIGFNVSGLLYNDSNSKVRFGLSVNYTELVEQVITYFLDSNSNISILLVPHVHAGYEKIESDLRACHSVIHNFENKYSNRILLENSVLDHQQSKGLIRHTDFFLGSRMHSCIGAISQCIPTIGLAYSLKFAGVFQSAGLGDSVADMRNTSPNEILEKIDCSFSQYKTTKTHLESTIPIIQDQIMNMFKDLKTEIKD